MNRNTSGTQIEESLVSRVANGLRYALTGNAPSGWFSPMDPIPPALNQEQAQQAGVAGRRMDFQVGYNVNIRPRHSEPIKFEHLRAMADNYDLLRLVIETRKDQVCEFPWQVQYREENGIRRKPDQRVKDAERLLRKPDQMMTWKEWLRMLLEDLFVLDAPAVYIRPNVAGQVWGFEPIDGATIKPVIDDTGRTPIEGPAYQQVLKGVPAVDYTRDELIYKPRNRRTHKVYGMSPVEQVINTVNVALRRQQFTLDYFTGGSVPDALAGVPESWTVEQVGQFQAYWDLLLSGENGGMSERRKLRFVPGEIAKNFKETKAPPLKDQFDEWLARVICYCFSIDVTPFVAQVNRSVAETNREQSLMEGLGPTLSWAKDLADDMLERAGFDDMELTWQEGKIVDPVKRQTVLCGYVTAKIMHPDEVRTRELGLDPLTPEQKADLTPPAPVAPGPGEDPEGGGGGDPPPGGRKKPEDGKEPADDTDSEKGAYLGKARRPGNKAKVGAQKKLAAAIEKFFDKQRKKLLPRLVDLLNIEKGVHRERARELASQIDLDWSDLVDDVEPRLAEVAVAAGMGALDQVDGLTEVAMKAMRKRAEEWAHDRAAEMVGMKWVDDELVPNPNAKWQITETTRDALRSLTEDALEEGWSAQRLADEMESAASFGSDRAFMVARTEMAKADSEGAMIGYKESGLVSGKEWQTAEDDKVSPECVECQEAGVIPLDQAFPSGVMSPPNHPNCRCVVLPVLPRGLDSV